VKYRDPMGEKYKNIRTRIHLIFLNIARRPKTVRNFAAMAQIMLAHLLKDQYVVNLRPERFKRWP
jgi:hypothetical protein